MDMQCEHEQCDQLACCCQRWRSFTPDTESAADCIDFSFSITFAAEALASDSEEQQLRSSANGRGARFEEILQVYKGDEPSMISSSELKCELLRNNIDTVRAPKPPLTVPT